LGDAFIAIDVLPFLDGRLVIFLPILMTFDMVEIKVKWLKLLHNVMNFCEYGIVIAKGVPW